MGQLEAWPGLEEADLYRTLDQEGKVVLMQRWRTREALVGYLCSEEFVRLLEVMDLSEKPPELRFETVSKREGLELVRALRTKELVNP